MDQQNQARRKRAFLPSWRRVAVGFVAATLIVVVSIVVARALPGSNPATKVVKASGGGCGTTSCVFTFKGHSADASLVTFGSDGCTQTSWSLTAAESVSRSNPGTVTSGKSAFVMVSQFNVCTGTDMLEASGCASAVDFQFANLDSASLNTTIPALDFISNLPVMVAVNLSWQGFGGTTVEIDSTHFFSPGFISSSHFIGSTRGAIVTGSVSFGETSFVSPNSGGGSGMSGDLSSTRSGSITVNRQQTGAGSSATPFSGGGC